MNHSIGNMNKGDVSRGPLATSGLSPSTGGSGGGGGDPWYVDIVTENLEWAYDFTRRSGASVLTFKAGGLYQATDLSGEQNDFTDKKGDASANLAKDNAGSNGVSVGGVGGSGLTLSRVNLGLSATYWWHQFFVIRCRNCVAHSSSANTTPGRKIHGSDGFQERPYFQFSRAGGQAVGDANARWAATANLTMDPVNLESLSGRAETGAANLYALIDWRMEREIVTEFFVNGYKVGTTNPGLPYLHDDVMIGLDKDGNGYDSGEWDVFAWAQGTPESDIFTTDNAAEVRSRMMKDFGISTWDGSTYPA